MNDRSNRERLRDCFRAVFPDASDAELEAASVTAMQGWDSVAQVTVVTLVEEEFGVTIPPEQYGDVNSFSAFLQVVGADR